MKIFIAGASGAVAGEAAVDTMTRARGISSGKASRELGWTLRHPGWRTGFLPELG